MNKQRDNRMMLVAGPCSVENREQLRRCVDALTSRISVDMIRCGVWKPRTRPGAFEGLGEPALAWIRELRDRYPDARFCCEVARPEHVALCERYGMEGVWIGARTSGNPFSVGELASALQGSQMTVMVKNPIAADVGLWQGAIERVLQAGVKKVIAVHRGFYLYHDPCPYRNKPLWEVPIELRRRMPEMPILCDPSHIGGQRKYLAELMTTAADLGFDGYMIEMHPHPDEALTDSEQQVDADGLVALLDTVARHRDDRSIDTRLHALRQQIDAIDERLIRALGDRMDISRKIAQLKRDDHIAVYQPKRWEELLIQRLQMADEAGVDTHFIETLYAAIHRESMRLQEETIASEL